MKSNKIRKKFLDFFSERDHTVVPSSPLVPDDPSVLLTTAGVQQFVPYYSKLDPMTVTHPLIGRPIGKNAVSVQKCFRTTDIDEVGDESHLTFFEMLGNFSFGGYFKEEAIKYAHQFIVEEMGLKIDYVSVFEGDQVVPADTESEKIWQSLGIKDIRKFGKEDNFWGPTGGEGPCGPTTEIYVNGALRRNQDKPSVEVWNIVFNEFYCLPNRTFQKLDRPGVDTGMGLERLVMVSENAPTIFETELFTPIVSLLPKGAPERLKRVATDHARGIVFLVADGVRPSNKEAGYILRRLIRRFVVQSEKYEFKAKNILDQTVEEYKEYYQELDGEITWSVFEEERNKFLKTLEAGIKEINNLKTIDAKAAFHISSTLGVPYEVIKEIGGEKAGDLSRADFDKEFERHQEISRAGLEKKFGGHGLLLDTGELKATNKEELERVLRLHTATHILQSALRKALGSEVEQRGSDVNAKRTRFDFSFPRKLTDEEKREVEKIMNEVVKADLPVQFTELPKAEAEKTGALYFFREKYPETVKVYYIGNSLESAVSKEFCGGPHVKRTGEIGKVKIKKEESVGAGIRRIKVVLG
jgi:alanyl-tRNA synthetase